MHILSNYCGYRQCRLILVFDAYKVKGQHGETEQYHNITVVYTKEAETADSYIEKATLDLSKKHKVRVATSDGMEQLIILGNGALRVSAEEFRQEVLQTEPPLCPGKLCRMVLDADPQEPGAAVQRDVPVSFDPHHRQYGYRSARELWLTMSDGPESTGHDPFREL